MNARHLWQGQSDFVQLERVVVDECERVEADVQLLGNLPNAQTLG